MSVARSLRSARRDPVVHNDVLFQLYVASPTNANDASWRRKVGDVDAFGARHTEASRTEHRRHRRGQKLAPKQSSRSKNDPELNLATSITATEEL